MDLTVVETSEEFGDLEVEFGVILLGQGNEDVHAVHDEAVGFSARSLTDGVEDVTGEGKELSGWVRRTGGGLEFSRTIKVWG